MFGLSLIIIAAAALLGTGLAALGLHLFFVMIEPNPVRVMDQQPLSD